VATWRHGELTIDGLRVGYSRNGEGPPLVLVHGAWSDARTWRHQLEGLADASDVIAWDAPGFGRSDDPPAAWRMPDYADCLAAFIAALGLGRPHVLGLSFGASLVLELYRRHPDLPRSLVLAGAYAGWAGSLPPEVVQARVARWEAESADLAAHVADYIPELFTASASPDDVAEVLAIMRDARASGMLAATHAMAEADLRDVLPRVEVPCLLLYGDSDRRSPLPIGQELHAAIPGSELVVFPGIGHLSNVDAPVQFNRAVRRFLSPAAS
jgi:pimeloyl-ACP methyl ester carboxylesterase